MATRHLAWPLLGLLVCLPSTSRAQEGEGESVAAQLGAQVAGAMKVNVALQPSEQVALVAPAGAGVLLFNPTAMTRLEQGYGQSAVAGVIARAIGRMKASQRGKNALLMAEAEAGCAFARTGIAYKGYQQAVAAGAIGASAEEASLRPARNASLVQGYLNCLMGQEPRVPQNVGVARRAPRIQTQPGSVPDAPMLAPAMAPFNSKQRPRKRRLAMVRPSRSVPQTTGAIDSVTGRPLVRPGSLNASALAGP